MSMHRSAGESVRSVTYRVLMKLSVGEVAVQLHPSQIALLGTCAANFMQQVRLGVYM